MTSPPLGPLAPLNGDEADAASIVARVEGRLDDVARSLDRTDWVELLAAVILALATVVAAWSAYQSSRWSGEQAKATATADALHSEASRAFTLAEAQAEIDSQVVVGWLLRAAEGDTAGMAIFAERVREEARPAFDAWLAMADEQGIPPGMPMDLPEYLEQAVPALDVARDAIERADESTATARVANQTSDDFVLMAVVMASVLFFAGVGSKFRGRHLRVVMVVMAGLVFVIGAGAMVSLPQSFAF